MFLNVLYFYVFFCFFHQSQPPPPTTEHLRAVTELGRAPASPACIYTPPRSWNGGNMRRCTQRYHKGQYHIGRILGLLVVSHQLRYSLPILTSPCGISENHITAPYSKCSPPFANTLRITRVMLKGS
ncbi:hypothetical protein EV426DRAFT_393738 [Tirmania nivea]|nr:hypothetical protein EV426DRAFT_393738 [Tirmania nivea]